MTPLTGMPDRSQAQSTFDANASSFQYPLPLRHRSQRAAGDVDAKKTLAETAATTATTQAGTATTQAGIATTQATLAANWATSSAHRCRAGIFRQIPRASRCSQCRQRGDIARHAGDVNNQLDHRHRQSSPNTGADR